VSAPEPLLTVADVQRRLGIGATLAREEIGRGAIRHVRIGRNIRITEQALADYIARCESPQNEGTTKGNHPLVVRTGGQGNGRQRRVS
jgi:excisionase family DNA binding protein